MISSVTITGIRLDVDAKTKQYIEKKIGSLEKYLPRHARKTASASVKIEQIDESDGNKYKVEVVLNVPDQVITAEDSTVNILAAVDIVEQKLATQLKKYKQTRMPHVGKRSVINRLKRKMFS